MNQTQIDMSRYYKDVFCPVGDCREPVPETAEIAVSSAVRQALDMPMDWLSS